jgi:hypothetical protein
MGVIGGRVVRTPDGKQPYKVVLEHEGDVANSEHPVATVREGETLIREKSPAPPAGDTMREWNSRPRGQSEESAPLFPPPTLARAPTPKI